MAHASRSPSDGWRGGLGAWREWRHTRPFWGALFVIAGGTEILLTEALAVPIVVHIGLQGVAGYLIPIVLLITGLLLLFHPVQRTFYSVVAIILALGCWITSNLGGFLIGMLAGVIGGCLAFAWRPSRQPEQQESRGEPPPVKQAPAGIELITRKQAAQDGPAADEPSGIRAADPQTPDQSGTPDQSQTPAEGPVN
ncbi:MAG TPA: DUF6114 domain-containing protein [Streptosporangiaceae bacterium]